jgi:hypothetical protein
MQNKALYEDMEQLSQVGWLLIPCGLCLLLAWCMEVVVIMSAVLNACHLLYFPFCVVSNLIL